MDLWDELLSITEVDPDFRFLMDGQSVVIEDYLAIRPEARSRLDRAVRDSRIEVGPWYTLPDGFLTSGESLVRNLQRGIQLAGAHGGSLRAGYLPDSFGHAAQMPQIYRQFGFNSAVVWRGVPLAVNRLAFSWRAPDGSEIPTAYMGTSYSHGVDLPADPEALAARIEAALKALAPFAPQADVLLMNGNDHVLPQRGLSATVRAANAHLDGIELKLAGLGEYLEQLEIKDQPVWQGELRSSARANLLMGTLSVRIPDKQLYYLAGSRLERVAEPLAALSGADCSGLLEAAWTLVLQNAAHDTACGSGIDAVAEEARLRSHAALQISEAITARCLPHLAGDGQIWNPSPYPRRGVVEVEVEKLAIEAQEILGQPPRVLRFRFPPTEIGRVHALLDERRIAGERISRVTVEREGTILRVSAETRSSGTALDLEEPRLEIERRAGEAGVEAIEVEIRPGNYRRVLIQTGWIPGFSVGAVDPSSESGDGESVRSSDDSIENEHLKCQLAADGTLVVEHKATGLVYRGLNSLLDEGDAGDEYNFSPPEADLARQGPEPIAPPAANEHGPLRASITTRVAASVPAGLGPDRRPLERMVRLAIVLTVALEKDSPRLDFTVELENTARDHRLRALFPIPFEPSHSHADSAYHVTPRAVIAPRRDPGSPELELPTYPMRSFVDLHGDGGGVALITQGLHEFEVIPGAQPRLALTLLRAVGWLSRDDLRYRTGHAGPPLQTPGAQSLGAQRFRYSLFFHAGDWEKGQVWRAAESYLLPLLPGAGSPVSEGTPSIELEPACVQMTACVPEPGGFLLRLVNASNRPQTALIKIIPAPVAVERLSLGGDLQETLGSAEQLRLGLRSWEIATLRVRALSRTTR